mmetsp:Transcript_12839/g.32031  ORF Transcript_12839/g.32031 Transcript_12839/m.32031 type:complete len:443 (+) Transcript_12839:389-1717(+)
MWHPCDRWWQTSCPRWSWCCRQDVRGGAAPTATPAGLPCPSHLKKLLGLAVVTDAFPAAEPSLAMGRRSSTSHGSPRAAGEWQSRAHLGRDEAELEARRHAASEGSAPGRDESGTQRRSGAVDGGPGRAVGDAWHPEHARLARGPPNEGAGAERWARPPGRAGGRARTRAQPTAATKATRTSLAAPTRMAVTKKTTRTMPSPPARRQPRPSQRGSLRRSHAPLRRMAHEPATASGREEAAEAGARGRFLGRGGLGSADARRLEGDTGGRGSSSTSRSCPKHQPNIRNAPPMPRAMPTTSRSGVWRAQCAAWRTRVAEGGYPTSRGHRSDRCNWCATRSARGPGTPGPTQQRSRAGSSAGWAQPRVTVDVDAPEPVVTLATGAAELAPEFKIGAVLPDVVERLHAGSGHLVFERGGDVGAGIRSAPEDLRMDLAPVRSARMGE